MKRLVLILVVLFAATTLFAGDGPNCSAHKAKTVQLTGTIATNADGTKIFRVADNDTTYTLCHKTKSEILALGENGATLAVKGKVVACDESDGEELMIETAKKV